MNKKNDILIQKLINALPQLQCQKCKYDDCASYAQAIVLNQENTSKCEPGSTNTEKQLKNILLNNTENKNQKIENYKIAYIDIDYIVKNSLAGKSIAEIIEKKNQINLKKFNDIETKLKSEEKEIIAQRNILNDEEFKKKINILKEKINVYRNQKKNEINNLNKQRFELTKKLLDELNPLLANYSTEKSLDMIVDKKSIIIGKKNLDITNDILKQLNKTLKNVEVN